MITVHLHNLIFNGRHGLYAEEAITGNQFEVNLDISFEKTNEIINIEDTVNYGEIYEAVKLEMQKPTDLLEVLSQKIIDVIGKKDERIKKIKISIFKSHAPINKFEGKVGVTMEKNLLP